MSCLVENLDDAIAAVDPDPVAAVQVSSSAESASPTSLANLPGTDSSVVPCSPAAASMSLASSSSGRTFPGHRLASTVTSVACSVSTDSPQPTQPSLTLRLIARIAAVGSDR
jgi:hypothetical protein